MKLNRLSSSLVLLATVFAFQSFSGYTPDAVGAELNSPCTGNGAKPTAIQSSTERFSADVLSPARTLAGTASLDFVNELQIPKGLGPMGSACTIVFTRHGEKQYPGNQRLTANGHEQAKALSEVLKTFEKNYVSFDRILHSSEPRSVQTASYFKEASPGTPAGGTDIQTKLRECEGGCQIKAQTLVNEIKRNYCKPNADGSPSMLFITGHGSLGKAMMEIMTGKSFSHPDCARPYVLTSSNGVNYDVLHSPGKLKKRMCSN